MHHDHLRPILEVIPVGLGAFRESFARPHSGWDATKVVLEVDQVFDCPGDRRGSRGASSSGEGADEDAAVAVSRLICRLGSTLRLSAALPELGIAAFLLQVC